jgi:exodeoxyribonuclease V alpha subunit
VLAESFGRYAERWSLEAGAPAPAARWVREAASMVSKATSAGQIFLHLSDLVSAVGGAAATLDPSAARALLLESRLVGSPSERDSMPLILDDDDRLYLHRYFDYESRLARALMERNTSIPPSRAAGTDSDLPANVQTLFDALFAANAEALGGGPDWQKISVALALSRRLTVISGGPGTGKTTAIVNLLACLLEGCPDCRIALAAPTGKAAARIIEAVRRRAVHLPEEIAAKLPCESFTVHRLLGGMPTGEFRHHADNLLPVDALIIDEASMLDLALATKLFEAVPRHARIILLGDKDQLAAVEAGAIFSELSAVPLLSGACLAKLARICRIDAASIRAPTARGPALLIDAVVWLTHSYRFATDSNIARLAAQITASDASGALTTLRNCEDGSLRWNDGGSGRSLPEATLRMVIAGYEQYIEAVRSCASDPAAIADAFGRLRVLCAVREGYRGTYAINGLVEDHFRRTLDHPLDPGARSDWYPGRPVMVLRNDYVLKLFNGDIGIVLPDEAGRLMVYFADGALGYRALPPTRLPLHETAFAMTIHKSQGSEFDAVIVILPGEANRVLTRELLYTGVTRARERVGIVGSQAALERTIGSRTGRDSGLLSRVREIDHGLHGT